MALSANITREGALELLKKYNKVTAKTKNSGELSVSCTTLILNCGRNSIASRNAN